MTQLALVIDLNVCVGCQACVTSCKEWNTSGEAGPLVDLRPYDADPTGTFFNRVQTFEVGEYPNTETVHFPKSCLHCEEPPCVPVCPTGASYKREEDGIVLIDQEKCRGWRMCVSGCPYKKIYYNWKTGKSEKCTFCYPRIEVGEPTVCSETCVGRIRYLGVMLYDADRIEEAASVPDEADLYESQLDVFLDPHDPEVIAEARRQGIPDDWLEAAQQSPVYKMAMDWKVAFPLHPEYRTLPMVWYCPPLSPIQSAADAGRIGYNGEIPDVDSLRIPVRYLANMLTAGEEEPIEHALNRMLAMRAFMRGRHVHGEERTEVLDRVGLDVETVEEMYRYMAIADYEDRFVIPTNKRETSESIYDGYSERGGCGFTFGSGCEYGSSDPDVFGGKPATKRKFFHIRADREKA